MAKLRPFRLSEIKLAHISMGLVGLMWVLPFLHYRHNPPIPTFDQEWWSALLGTLALVILIGRDYWQQPEIPRIVQLPVALVAVVCIQSILGKIGYLDQTLLYVLYLLFAALVMMLGSRLRDFFGMARLAQVLAIFLLVGAELGALIGVSQHYRWHTVLDAVVNVKASSGVYGNLAQVNHLANYIALGMVSLGLLYRQQCLKTRYVIVLVAPLLLVLTLTGSRSSWLYLLLMAGLAWWWARRDAAQRPLLRYSLLLIVGFALMHLIVQLPFMSVAGSSNTLQRLFGSVAGGSDRLYLWREAGVMFMHSPWMGVGFGQFDWQHFQMLPVLRPDNISGLYNNAHNLIFHLAAEMGIAGLLALSLPLGFWLHGLRRATLDAAHWWGYAVLGVLGIHSMLEYPLWYLYFVAVAAVLLGALDETRYRLELRGAGRVSVAAILLVGLMTLAHLRSGYHQLEQTLAMLPASTADRNALKRTRDGLAAIHGGSLLLPYAELVLSQLIEARGGSIEENLDLNDRVLRYRPISAVAYYQALLLAQAGRQRQAESMLEQAIWSYPEDFPGARQQIEELAEKDPERFSALLKFGLQKEQERSRAVYHQ